MNYIQLSRILDNEARNCGYQHFPDDILSVILDYEGGYKTKARNMYKIRFKCDESWIRHYGTPDNPQSRIVKRTKWYKIFYCDCCDKYFVTKPNNHDNGSRHKKKDKKNKPLLSNKLVFTNGFDWFRKKYKWTSSGYGNPREFTISDIGLWN